MNRLLGTLVLVFLLVGAAWAAPPAITISAPTAGQSFDTTSSVITCSGTVANGADGYASLYLNGYFVQNVVLDLTRNPATFSTQLVLVSGTNKIEVSDTNSDGTETGTVTVTSSRIRNDLRVNMVWNDGASDVDLHLFCPADAGKNINAEHISWHHKTGANGGSLDVDNVTGYGPENISFPAGKAPRGSYVGAVNLYSRSGAERNIAVRITIFLNEGTNGQSVQYFDTFVVTVPNAERDVATTGDQPSNVNSNSTKFFSFSFSPYGYVSEGPAKLISYPNPFLPGTQAQVTIKSEGGTVIDFVTILSVEGNVIRTIAGNGTEAITWDGRNAQGDQVASGSYLFAAKLANGRNAICRMTLVR